MVPYGKTRREKGRAVLRYKHKIGNNAWMTDAKQHADSCRRTKVKSHLQQLCSAKSSHLLFCPASHGNWCIHFRRDDSECPLISNGVIKMLTAENIAGSDLGLKHLRKIFDRSWKDGLYDVFTSKNSEGQLHGHTSFSAKVGGHLVKATAWFPEADLLDMVCRYILKTFRDFYNLECKQFGVGPDPESLFAKNDGNIGGNNDPAYPYGDDAGVASRPVTPDYDCPKPPRIKRRDLISDEETFRLIDEHSVTAPPDIKEDFFKLVDYLTEVTCSPIEHVRAFYIWITHNINYDTSGFFGRSLLMPTDSTFVLKNRVTVCKGYTELMEAFCSLVHIPVKTVYGYVKAYGYQAGTDVASDRFNAHAWNVVFIKNEWRLLDATWGAGFVKSHERVYIPKFNDVYFLTDPSVFITDHFPYKANDAKYSDKWQLLETPLDKKSFNDILNMDKYGKAWGIETVSHKNVIISDVQFDLDIVLKETFSCLSDYVAFMFMDGKKLPQYAYVYKMDSNKVNIHVSLPVVGDIVLQLYGRRATDDKTANLEPLLKYILNVSKVHDTVIPYPLNHTVYGPVADFVKYGVSDVGDICHVTETGELTLSVTPIRHLDLIPRLHFGDHTEDLKRFVFMNYSDNFGNIDICIRLPFKGNFKLNLFGNAEGSNTFKPFMTYILENKDAISNDVFPIALSHSVKFKCRLCEPLSKAVPSKSKILFKLKSQSLAVVSVEETCLEMTEDSSFSGVIDTPRANCDVRIYGAEESGGALHPLYVFHTV